MIKPNDTDVSDVSDAAWETFKTLADMEGISLDNREDWMPWFIFFEAGYRARMGNNNGH